MKHDPNIIARDLAAAAGLEARLCHHLLVLGREVERINDKRTRLRAQLALLQALSDSVEFAERRLLPVPSMVVEP